MKRRIARDLLKIKAVFLRPEEPFTWASGIKSPIYCDNRLTLSDVEVRDDVEQALAKIVRRHYPECEMVMGTSTAGIAHAALVADILEIPMGYVRNNAKDHGRNNQIEGRCEPGTKVVVIEDLISTAGSAVDVAEALRAAGAEVLGIASIFNYGMKAGEDRLRDHGLKNVSATNYDVLLEVACGEGYIKKKSVPALKAFRDNPSDESWIKNLK
ncbi:MAG: orotate phosphoribosyltransferase [Erysipelotrichaceae bacterium]|nr:orotate phosphoribosyltransferase [Erysipelotrichaceae bacterium]MDO5439095.1 orotate phosphoribosyltransferase [Erysipelotrichaceae bacterium]